MKISPLREFIWSAMLWLPLMFALWFALSTVVAFPIVRLAHADHGEDDQHRLEDGKRAGHAIQPVEDEART